MEGLCGGWDGGDELEMGWRDCVEGGMKSMCWRCDGGGELEV